MGESGFFFCHCCGNILALDLSVYILYSLWSWMGVVLYFAFPVTDYSSSQCVCFGFVCRIQSQQFSWEKEVT